MISSSLFHFTRKISNLKLILRGKKFRASYNIENVQAFFPNESYLAIPMVCFCDIPLKFITDNHTKRYGYFGLGFRKEWGLKNKINPISYRTKESSSEKFFHDLMVQVNFSREEVQGLKLLLNSSDGMFQTEFERIEYANSMILDRAIKIAAYVKPYLDNDTGKERNNYLDREWRWVPNDVESTFCESNNEIRRGEINQKYFNGNPDYLTFEVEDLNYFIVRKRSGINKAVNLVRSLNLSEIEMDNLIQKIIDIESINLDM